MNGGGRAVFPPAAITPIALYRQPEPGHRRMRLLARMLLWLVAGLVMLALSFVGGLYIFFHESVAAVRAHSLDVRIAQRKLDVALPGHAAIALIVGYDHRAGVESGGGSRSDTIMLLRTDPVTKSISMLSFPRDLIVKVECPGKGSYRGKINSAYNWCGSQGTLQTVKDLTGLPINYLITVNFHAFKEIVNRVGGVWIDVDRRYYNDNRGLGPGSSYATINLQPGYQRLTGGSALDFVRYRHTDSDFYRLARQQQFIRALKEQVAHNFSVTSLPKIIGAITHDVEVGVGGGGELSAKTVLSQALFAYTLPPGHFFQAKIANLYGSGELRTDSSNLRAAIQDFVNPDVQAPKQATQVALGIKPKAAPVLPPAQTSITVLNGNGVTGSASNAAYELAQRGYRILVPPSGKPANAPRFDYFHTKVYYRAHDEAGKAAATKVADLFGAADVEWLPKAIEPLANGSRLVVTVGQTFHGSIAPPPPVSSAPVKRTPAAVRYAARETKDLLRQVRAQVPFRLEVPTEIERNSRLDREKPIRVYTIDERRQKAVRLTFRTGGNLYWGIEETAWKDAPVLADRNFKHVLKGREFDLYYSGPHLHMVALHENGATYWVVNSLLDDLSNDTMLAIARGLRPLGRR